MLNKDEIRRAMRERRRALTSEERTAASEIICAKLAADANISLRVDPLDWGSPVAVYLASPQEIDLSPFIRKMRTVGAKVVAPRWNGEIYELAALKGLDEAHLRQGPMGILEPAEAEIVSPKEVEVWIVPGLAFTRNGKRLGYGGGWYDRLLAEAPKRAWKIGIAHEFQVVDDLPSEPHDVLLDDVIDDSFEHELVDFTTRENGFSAHVGIPNLGRRRRNFVLALLGVLLSPAMIGAVIWMAAHGVSPLGVIVASIATFTVSAIAAVFVLFSFGAPVEALIEVAGEKGVCRRRFLGILPLPTKRFPWSCWAHAGGTYGFYSAGASHSFSVFEGGVEYRLFKADSEAAVRLSMRMNCAKRPPEDAAYRTARTERLGKLPFGMWVRKTKDGLGDEALIWPHAMTMAIKILFGMLVIGLFVGLILELLTKIPVVGWWIAAILGGLLGVAIFSSVLHLLGVVIFSVLGVYRLTIWADRIEYAWGIAPLMRRHTMSRSALAIDADTDEVCEVDAKGKREPLFTMLPVRYKLPLRLFVESVLGYENRA